MNTTGLTVPRDAKSDTPTCGPTAVATLAGVTVAEVTRALKARYVFPKRWAGKTCLSQLLWVLQNVYGLKTTPASFVRRTSVAAFCERQATLGARYLVRVSGHFIVVCNGLVIDQGGARLYSTGSIGRKRITHCHRIEA